MNPEGNNDEKKGMKLNLGAGEYKPKAFVPSANYQQNNNANNPYGGQNYQDPNMYNNNPYGGYDQNQQMNYNQQGQGQNNYNQQGQGQNNMYQQQQFQQNQMYGQNQQDQQWNNNQQNQQWNNNPQNQQMNNTQQTAQPKVAPKGIAGLPGVKVAAKATNPNQNKTNVKTANKPGTAQGKREEKKTVPKKEVAKPEVKKVEKDVEDVSNKLDEIDLEQTLVDDSKEGSMIEVDTVKNQ